MAGRHVDNARVTRFAPSTRLGRAGLGAVMLGVIGGAVAPNAMADEAHGASPAKKANVVSAKVSSHEGSAEVKAGATSSWAISSVAVSAKKAEAPKPAPAPVAPARAAAQAPAAATAGNAATQGAQQAPAAQAAVASPAASTSGSATGEAIAAFASKFVGSPYVWAGTTPSGWDCVGFTSYVYAKFGINAPRSHALSAYAGFQRVSEAEARPGDIMVWPGRHTAIYLGGGKNVSALSPKLGTDIMTNKALGGGAIFFRLAK